MAEIHIPFNKWSNRRLRLGEKCATSRYSKYGAVGDTFKVGGKTFLIKLIEELPLWFVRDALFKSEGCSSPKEFEQVWNEIHPIRFFAGKDIVFYHYFKEVKKP